jgi:hypothetical protein
MRVQVTDLPLSDETDLWGGEEWLEIAEWCGGEIQSSGPISVKGGSFVFTHQMLVDTPEGKAYLVEGDRITKDLNGIIRVRSRLREGEEERENWY